MKKIYQILWIIVSAILFGTMGLILFMSFAGNGCMIPDPDPTCQCFCCHMFGLRGYESCGNLGLLIGSLGGGI